MIIYVFPDKQFELNPIKTRARILEKDSDFLSVDILENDTTNIIGSGILIPYGELDGNCIWGKVKPNEVTE